MPDTAAFDLERIVPELLSPDDPLERETLEIHRARYAFAGRFVAGKQVLDLACGVGYGAAMLKEAGAAFVTGVDVSPQALAHARKAYGTEGIRFVEADAFAFVPEPRADVIVSLETIEHVPDPKALVERFAALLAPGATFVGSVPVTMSSDVNPHHLHDFTAAGFRKVLKMAGFEPFDELLQVQNVSPLRLLKAKRAKTKRDYSMRPGLLRYFATHPRAIVGRALNTLRHGFDVKYLVVASKRR